MIHDMKCFGETLDSQTIIKVLRELNPDLVFDPAGNLGYYHPQMGSRMGVWHNDRHVASLERGAAVPEFNVWGLVNGKRSHIVRIGWRHTLEKMTQMNIPGVTWESLCRKLKIDRKVFTGDPLEIAVA